MFQAQRIVNGKCRPLILHGYGGAKKEMPTSLAGVAKFGWIPMAAAMVGSASSPPLWTGQDWRPIFGTSLDTRILPPPLSEKESLLLLSQWIRLPRDDLHIRHATNSWLSPNKVNVALGPDCDISPHPIRELPLDLETTPYLDLLFGPQKADQGHASQMAKQEGSRDFTIAGGQLSSSRIVSPHQDFAWWNSCQLQKLCSLSQTASASL